MLPEIGLFLLFFSLSMTIALLIVPSIGIYKNNIALQRISSPLAISVSFLVILSFITLMLAFAWDDFSVKYVAINSNSTLPWFYKLTAVWGSHEGSLLLWLTILSGWMFSFAIVSKKSGMPDEVIATSLTVMAVIALGFTIFILKSSNPFLRSMTEIPLDGNDLNPLLQDIGLIIHPPILYMGYVGFTVPFAIAIASLLHGSVDSNWANWMRPWALLAWGFLSLGIALGSWWAYYELGWGGWWFWDPVENASFMPWLSGTALLHSISAARQRSILFGWMVFLAIISFSLSLLGTFLVRSGVLTSVHAFASDPERGMFILQFLILVVGSSLFIYGIRSGKIRKTQPMNLFSRESLLLTNNMLLLVATGTVLLGTLYPLIFDAIYSSKISVGYPYFNAVFIPIMLPFILLMLPAIFYKWGKNKHKAGYLMPLIFISGLTAIVISFNFKHEIIWQLCLGVTLGLSLALSLTIELIKKSQLRKTLLLGSKFYTMWLAHMGVAITILGITLVSNFEIEQDKSMRAGDVVKLGSYQVKLQEISAIDGSNYIGHRGTFVVSKNSEQVATLLPEKRIYYVQQMPMSETAINPGLFRDIYIALGEQLDADNWSCRIYFKPFVRWIWLGAIFMFVAAMLGVRNNRA